METEAGKNMMTCKIHEPGERVIRQFATRIRDYVVPSTHVLVACEACEWDTTVPLRMGRDQAEALRRRHLETVHWTDQLAGRVCINEELSDPWELVDGGR